MAVIPLQTDLVDAPAIRKEIQQFQTALAKIPGAYFGDTDNCPLRHSFGGGMYMREIFIPKGHLVVGKIHKHTHPNFLLKGKVLVITEGEGKQQLDAPLALMSQPGTKRVVLALEDTWWVTVHKTESTDLAEIENEVIAKDYDELERS